jgi:hypothetical protein
VTAFGWRDGCEPTISKPTSFIRRALPCHTSTEADLSHDRFWGANPSCRSPSSMTKDDAPQQSFLAGHRCVRRSSVTTSPAALQREIGALTGPVIPIRLVRGFCRTRSVFLAGRGGCIDVIPAKAGLPRLHLLLQKFRACQTARRHRFPYRSLRLGHPRRSSSSAASSSDRRSPRPHVWRGQPRREDHQREHRYLWPCQTNKRMPEWFQVPTRRTGTTGSSTAQCGPLRSQHSTGAFVCSSHLPYGRGSRLQCQRYEQQKPPRTSRKGMTPRRLINAASPACPPPGRAQPVLRESQPECLVDGLQRRAGQRDRQNQGSRGKVERRSVASPQDARSPRRVRRGSAVCCQVFADRCDAGAST